MLCKVLAAGLLLTTLLAAQDKPTREEVRQARAEFAAQEGRQRTNNRAQRRFVKAQRKAWKRSLKPPRSHTRKATR